ncbi:Ty1/Copia family ribonuclease HI, partial [Klebsiella pneumoniae]
EGYSDASWIAKKSGSNGVTGYVFTLAGGAISWKSSKQTIITRSTFEAELCALDATGTEAEWLHGLMSVIPVVGRPLPAFAVYCDSRTTIDKIDQISLVLHRTGFYHSSYLLQILKNSCRISVRFVLIVCTLFVTILSSFI